MSTPTLARRPADGRADGRPDTRAGSRDAARVVPATRRRPTAAAARVIEARAESARIRRQRLAGDRGRVAGGEVPVALAVRAGLAVLPTSVPAASAVPVGRRVVRPAASAGCSLRLTTRARWVASALTVAAAALLVAVAHASAPHTAAASDSVGHDPAAGSGGSAVVVVRPGDTLWAIALRVAPGRDPRAEVSDLVRLNGVRDARLTPGQVLQLPAAA